MSSISIESSGSPIQTALKQQLFRRRHIGPVHHWVTDSDKCQSASFNCLSSAALSFVLIHFNSSAFNKISSLQCSSAYPDKILLYLPTEEDTLLAVWGQKPENEVRWAFSLLIEFFSSTGNITIYKISKNIKSLRYIGGSLLILCQLGSKPLGTHQQSRLCLFFQFLTSHLFCLIRNTRRYGILCVYSHSKYYVPSIFVNKYC